MHLRDWLVREGKSPSAFASEIGLTQSTINRMLGRSGHGTHRVMAKVIAGTKGEVTPNDFHDIPSLVAGGPDAAA
jgi:lambda repressor-like predicted transcriptional regulator